MRKRKRKPKRPQPHQSVMCRGFKCRCIVAYRSLWCPLCWRLMPKVQRERVERAGGYVSSSPSDPDASALYRAALADADRSLREVRS